MRKILATVVLTTSVTLCGGISTYAEVKETNIVSHLFIPTKEDVTKENWLRPPYLRWAYTHMNEFTMTNEVKKAPTHPSIFSEELQALDSFPVKLENGETIALQTLLDTNKTDAFVVIQNGKLVYEHYFNEYNPHAPHGLASLAKAFTGTLIQILAEEHRIDLNEPAGKYVTGLQNTPFGKATIQQLMDMQVSAEYPTHGYTQKKPSNQDAQLYLACNMLPRIENYDGPMRIYDMLQEATETALPGGQFSYNNGSAEALGWIIRTVTGKSLAENVSERIWSQIGMEDNAYYVTDETGIEQASAGFNATARDMARFGQLLLNDGQYNGKQIIPASISKDIKNVKKGELSIQAGDSTSYHNQWWIPHNEHGAFEAVGSYGQRLYIDPEQNMVIVHLSSNAESSGTVRPIYSAMYMDLAKHLSNTSEE